MPTIRELQDKRLELHKGVRSILDNEKATAEDKIKADGLLVEMNSIKADIDRIHKADEAEAELRKIDFKPEADPGDKKKGDKGGKGGDGDGDEKRTAEQQTELELRAFYKFCMRDGRRNLTPEENSVIKPAPISGGGEVRGTPEGTAPGFGGELIPPAFQRNLEVAMKYYANFEDWATVFDTPDGAPMIWPVSDSTSRMAQLVPEGSAVTDIDIGTSKLVFGAYKFGDLVKVGMEIDQDSFTSVSGIVTDAFAQSFGRALGSYFTNGTGVNQPTGIVTAATAGPEAVGNDNATSPNPLTQVGYYDMLNLLHSVDLAYRNQPGAKWMFSDPTLLVIQQLKDLYGRPLWQPSFIGPQPDLILNKPYVVNNFMLAPGATTPVGSPPTPTGDNISVLFGDLSRYKVRRVKTMTIQRLVERYAEYGQIALIAWARYDGNLLDAGQHPVKYLTS